MRFFPVLAAVFCLAPSLAAAADSPQAPPALVASLDGVNMRLSWLPPSQAPEYYKLYGVTATGDLVYLESTTDLVRSVASGYANYAVKSVVGAQVSLPTYALNGLIPYCVESDPGSVPPYRVYEC
jgi:hypothetical protein